MKKLSILIITSIIFFGSCEEPPIVFNGPQPTALKPQQSIDMIYRGVFLCESDSAIVRINAKTIYKEKPYSFTIKEDQLSEYQELKLVDNELLIDGWSEPLPTTIKDSIISATIMIRDTLFQIGPDQTLKSFRGHQVLSKQLSDKKWEVQILSLDYDYNLQLSEAQLPEDIEQLKKMTKVKDISTEEKTQYLLSPTLMEFDEILKQELIFEACDIFTRINIMQEI